MFFLGWMHQDELERTGDRAQMLGKARMARMEVLHFPKGVRRPPGCCHTIGTLQESYRNHTWLFNPAAVSHSCWELPCNFWRCLKIS